MVARSKAVAWVNIIVGVVLGTATGVAAAPPGPDTPALGAANPSPARPSRAHVALNSAIECNRRGEYEQAAVLFQQAQAGLGDLSPQEQDELARWLPTNNAALQARRDGAIQVAQAEEALRAGRAAEAAELARKLQQNQYLAAADRDKANQVSDQVRRRAPAGPAAPDVPGATPALGDAREKLKQARVLLAKGQFDAAEQLANDAAVANSTYDVNEDNPAKVQEDVRKARSDPKALLAAARKCLETGDLDRAEQFAHASEKAESMFSFRWWGDSPAQVLKDVQVARKAGKTAEPLKDGAAQEAGMFPPMRSVFGGPKADAAPVAPTAESAKDKALRDQNTQQARQLLQQARRALQDGNAPLASQLSGQARALKPNNLQWWDKEEELYADVQRALAGKKDGPGAPAPVAEGPVDNPKALLKQAREAYTAGRLDDAAQMVRRVRAATNVRYGLFEDSPDKLQQDIDRGRQQRDQEESVQVLGEGRKLYEQGDLDGAARLAYRAQKLHGPYSIWDLGDRPQKLLADVQTAQQKNRGKPPVPPLPGQGDLARRPGESPGQNVAGTPPRPLFGAQEQVRTTNPPAPPLAGPGMMPPNPLAGPVPPEALKGRAQQLLAEARQMQREGRLVEARQRALDARSTGAPFGPNEDSPELALIQLSSLCYKRVDGLMQEAGDYLRTAGNNPAAFQKAEQNMAQARELALRFGLDTQPMDARLDAARQQRFAAGVPAPALGADAVGQVHVAGGPTPEPAPAGRGQTLLAQARTELRRGETQAARKLAEEAFTGPYGVQADAEKVLRSVDAEEFGQKRLAAERTLQAGLSALHRNDYEQAATIMRSIDRRLLDDKRQADLKRYLALPQMQVQTAAAKPKQGPDVELPGGLTPAGTCPLPAEAGVARATDTPAPERDLLKTTQAMQDVKFQQLRQQSLEVQRQAAEHFKAGDTDRALEVLREYADGLNSLQLDPDRVALLRRPVESRLMQFKTLKAQRDFEKTVRGTKDANHDLIKKDALVKKNKEEKVADLMKQYDTFYKEGKYTEAEMVASAAHELDPDNATAAASAQIARIQSNQVKYKNIKDRREDFFLNGMDETEDEGQYVGPKEVVHFDPERAKLNAKRGDPSKGIPIINKSDKNNEITHSLSKHVRLNFTDTPLEQVLDDLRSWHNINIVPDLPAIESEGISLKRPVSIKLEDVSLKSALNMILHQAHLIWVIKDEVLQVTTEHQANGTLETRTFQVSDLVLPVENFGMPGPADLLRALDDQRRPATGLPQGQASPYTGPFQMQNGQPVSSPGNPTPPTSPVTPFGRGPGMPGNPTVGGTSVTRSRSQTSEDALIQLIKNTIKPQSWADMGGTGTIDYFPPAMTLVVNQASDIQEQIADLLAALRRLQDQEVAIEVRFISIAEGFFERIGLDFNINIKTDRETARFEPQITSQQFKPFGFINDFSPDRFITGLTPAGTFTSDLDIPLKNSSFGMAIPPFGGFPNIPGGNGGIELGLAFLSDIQVFLFMEAAQGDQRTNVMQAPKLTMYNGQTASLSVTDSQFFVTNVNVVQVQGQLAFFPNNSPFPTQGVNLTVQAVISADRRYVRLSLAPILTNLASAVVPLFPIVTPIIPTFEGGFQGQPVVFTQFIQQPVINFISVQTTVNVPDGGTVLMGGLKRLSEGRNEFGPPVLSKIPYINRLFKNVGYGREAESLMIMVTPRVIINEEEEYRQTGVGRPPE